MMRKTVPAWALEHLDRNLPPDSPRINVHRHGRGTVIANTRLGSAIVTRRWPGPPQMRFLPNPRERIRVACRGCDMQMEVRQLSLPTRVHCGSCGAPLDLDAQGVLMENAAAAPGQPAQSHATAVKAAPARNGKDPATPPSIILRPGRCQAMTASGRQCLGKLEDGKRLCPTHQKRHRSSAILAKEAFDAATRKAQAGTNARQAITEAVHEQAFAETGAEAQRYERMKRTLINSAAHELQTPMTPLLLSLNALQRDDGPRGESLQQVVRSAKRLEDVIGRLLKVSQLQAAPMALGPRAVEVSSLVRSAVAAWQARADAAGVTMRARVPLRMSWPVDEARVRELLDHLLSNAIRFCPPGGRVTVTANRRRNRAVLSVSDTGSGVPDAERERVFEPFVQLENATFQTEGGLGLGLFFVRAIAEAHGGTATIEGGRGTKVVVVLPRAPIPPSNPKDKSTQPSRSETQ